MNLSNSDVKGKRLGEVENGDGRDIIDEGDIRIDPTPKDIKYIRVSDEIPVTVFGVPLPVIKPTYVCIVLPLPNK
jgi:hypothetical protein